MAAIRAVVVTISPRIVDIITTVLSRRRRWESLLISVIELVSSRSSPPSLPILTLIVLQQGELHQISCPLLEIVPRAMVIAFSNEWRNAHVHEMRAHSTMLANVSPRRLLNAIRHRFPRSDLRRRNCSKRSGRRLRSSAVTELGPAAFCWRVMRRGRARMACLGPGQIANLCHENSFSADVGSCGLGLWFEGDVVAEACSIRRAPQSCRAFARLRPARGTMQRRSAQASRSRCPTAPGR